MLPVWHLQTPCSELSFPWGVIDSNQDDEGATCMLQLVIAMRLPGMQGVESICVVGPWKDAL